MKAYPSMEIEAFLIPTAEGSDEFNLKTFSGPGRIVKFLGSRELKKQIKVAGYGEAFPSTNAIVKRGGLRR